MTTKTNRNRLLTGLAVFAATALVWLALSEPAQAVRFEGVPTSNSCGYPWVLTLVGCDTWIGPHGAKTLDCTTNLIRTPNGDFAGPPGVAIYPGNVCFFHMCGNASITLTCGPIGGDNEPAFKAKQNIQFSRVKD